VHVAIQLQRVSRPHRKVGRLQRLVQGRQLADELGDSVTTVYSLKHVSGVDLATPADEHHGGTAEQEQSAKCADADRVRAGGGQPAGSGVRNAQIARDR